MYQTVWGIPPYITTTTITDTTTVPKEAETDEEWEEEEITIIKRRRRVKPEPMDVKPWPEVKPWVPDGTSPWTTPTITWGWKDEPCMFDGLPPGVYGIACPCPKHRVTC